MSWVLTAVQDTWPFMGHRLGKRDNMADTGIQRGARRESLDLAKYGTFAMVAGAANLVSQEIVVRTDPLLPVAVSILAGTVVAFLVKYLLVKRWVFADPYHSHVHEARKVVFYCVLGFATTTIFWACELAAWWIWRDPAIKYAGAVIGLVLSHVAKYFLDRDLVFTGPPREQPA